MLIKLIYTTFSLFFAFHALADEPISVYSYEYSKHPSFRPIPFVAEVKVNDEKREFEVLAYGYSKVRNGYKNRVLRDRNTGLIWSTFVATEKQLESKFGKYISIFTYDQNNLKTEINFDFDAEPAYIPYAVTVGEDNEIKQQTLCTSDAGHQAFMGVLSKEQIKEARLPYYDEIEETHDYFATKLFDYYTRGQELWTSGGDVPEKIRFPYYSHTKPKRAHLENVICVFETDPSTPLESLDLNIVNPAKD